MSVGAGFQSLLRIWLKHSNADHFDDCTWRPGAAQWDKLSEICARNAGTEFGRQHHFERLDLLRRASEDLGRPAPVAELSTHLFSPRAQGPMADSETFAHLEHLRLAGEFERRESPSGFEYVRSG